MFRDVLRTLGSVERELMTVDGTEQHYLMRVNPYRTVSNVISGVVVTFSDVTELKRAQEREATLAAVVESSSDAIVSRDLEGRITSWNAAAEALFWYTAADAVGKPFIDLVPPEQREQHRLLDQQVRDGRAVSAVESTMLRRDRQQLLISMTVSPVRDRRGGLRGVSVILRDISEKRRIAIERARLAAIVESSDDAIISKDLNGVITSWNPGAERLFGYSAEEMVGTPIYRIVPTDHPEDVPRILSAVARGENVKHYDTVRVAKDGRRIQVWLSVSPIRDESGQIVGASKIARDITERIAAENALKRGLELRDEFISFASHELKTPLTSMKIQVDRMKRGIARDDTAVSRGSASSKSWTSQSARSPGCSTWSRTCSTSRGSRPGAWRCPANRSISVASSQRRWSCSRRLRRAATPRSCWTCSGGTTGSSDCGTVDAWSRW